jgi:hypothetical protein
MIHQVPEFLIKKILIIGIDGPRAGLLYRQAYYPWQNYVENLVFAPVEAGIILFRQIDPKVYF